MKTTINQDVKTCEVCGHTGTDVHEWPTYKNSQDTKEYQCDDYEACLTRKCKRAEASWPTARCACGRLFKYPPGDYIPTTCGAFGCEHNQQHPKLRRFATP